MITAILGGIAALGTYINVNKVFRAVGGNSSIIEILGGGMAGAAAGFYVWKTSNKLCEAVAGCFKDANVELKIAEPEPVPEEEDHSLEVFVNEKGDRFYQDFDGKLHKLEPEGTVVE